MAKSLIYFHVLQLNVEINGMAPFIEAPLNNTTTPNFFLILPCTVERRKGFRILYRFIIFIVATLNLNFITHNIFFAFSSSRCFV